MPVVDYMNGDLDRRDKELSCGGVSLSLPRRNVRFYPSALATDLCLTLSKGAVPYLQILKQSFLCKKAVFHTTVTLHNHFPRLRKYPAPAYVHIASPPLSYHSPASAAIAALPKSTLPLHCVLLILLTVIPPL